MVRLHRLALLFALTPALSSYGATYFVSSEHGSDNNAGTSATQPWKTLHRVNTAVFQPGDRILFAADSTWHEQLAPASSGSQAKPIVLDRYGEGPLPHIAGDGSMEDAVLLRNVQNIELHHLEITNTGAPNESGTSTPRRGVEVFLDDFGTATHIVIADLYIHDVNGTNAKKDNGGIIFRTHWKKTPSRFDGLSIERNIVWKVDRSGIVGESDHISRTRWYPSLHVVIRDNYVEDIGGDGIVPWATDGALVEHNIARKCNQRSTDYNAGIWQWSTDNTTLRLNEASNTHGTHDGEGFDSDYNSRNTHYEYNYSHDNDGGFMLICTPVERDRQKNLGNIGTVVRHNISRNDHARLINLSGADNVTVADNAFYIGPDHDVEMLVSDWKGWSQNATFQDNSFYVEGGTLRFGHAVSRSDSGVYTIAAGFAPAQNIVYTGNNYFGTAIDAPPDDVGPDHHPASAPRLDWKEPQFDPSSPAHFDSFMAAHRKWLTHLLAQQFGQAPR